MDMASVAQLVVGQGARRRHMHDAPPPAIVTSSDACLEADLVVEDRADRVASIVTSVRNARQPSHLRLHNYSTPF
jgi:hypothetical protein